MPVIHWQEITTFSEKRRNSYSVYSDAAQGNTEAYLNGWQGSELFKTCSSRGFWKDILLKKLFAFGIDLLCEPFIISPRLSIQHIFLRDGPGTKYRPIIGKALWQVATHNWFVSVRPLLTHAHRAKLPWTDSLGRTLFREWTMYVSIEPVSTHFAQ